MRGEENMLSTTGTAPARTSPDSSARQDLVQAERKRRRERRRDRLKSTEKDKHIHDTFGPARERHRTGNRQGPHVYLQKHAHTPVHAGGAPPWEVGLSESSGARLAAEATQGSVAAGRGPRAVGRGRSDPRSPFPSVSSMLGPDASLRMTVPSPGAERGVRRKGSFSGHGA